MCVYGKFLTHTLTHPSHSSVQQRKEATLGEKRKNFTSVVRIYYFPCLARANIQFHNNNNSFFHVCVCVCVCRCFQMENIKRKFFRGYRSTTNFHMCRGDVKSVCVCVYVLNVWISGNYFANYIPIYISIRITLTHRFYFSF